jgi:hypothetical protein
VGSTGRLIGSIKMKDRPFNSKESDRGCGRDEGYDLVSLVVARPRDQGELPATADRVRVLYQLAFARKP